MNTTQESQQHSINLVRVVDVKMPFGSMVTFMVKWAIAAIPAILNLMIVGFFGSALLAGFVRGIHI